MLGESWTNEVLGKDAGHPDPTAAGETPTIVNVVNGFLRNDSGFSRAEVSTYINNALQNEAGDIHSNYAMNKDLVEYAQTRAEQAEREFSDTGEHGDEAQELRTKADAAERELTETYDGGRAALAGAVMTAQRSRLVLIEPETSDWVVRLDHDGLISETMGQDVAEVFGRNRGNEANQREAASRGVDFSKDSAGSRAAQRSRETSMLALRREARMAARAHAAQASAEVPVAVDRGRTKSEPVKASVAIGKVLADLARKNGRPNTEASKNNEPGLG